MDKPLYNLLYKLDAKPDGVLAEDVPEGFGACTAGVFMSLIYPPDGSYSSLLISLDGRTGEELEPKEEFKAWIMAALALAKKLPADDGRRRLAQLTFETWVKGVFPDTDINEWRKSHNLPEIEIAKESSDED